MKRVYSVLIAEDESEIRRALAAMVEEHPSFRGAGCAGDGKAALRMIEALRPDVLMTDIRMPYMDGLELLQALDVRGIRIKTVIISGYSSFSYARTAMKYGASDYLLKPLLPAQCQQTLDLLEKALDLQAGSFSLDIALQKPSPLPQMQAEAYLLAACLGNYPFCAGDKGTDAAALRAYVKQSGLDVDSAFAGSRFGLAYLLLYAQTREEAVQTVRILFQTGLSGLFRHHSRCVFPPCSGRTDADTAGTCRKTPAADPPANPTRQDAVHALVGACKYRDGCAAVYCR